MNGFAMLRQSACLGIVGLLAGCTLPTRVPIKDVLADQAGFLQANFSVDKVPPAVRSTIADADNGPLGFHRMELTLTWARQGGSKADDTSSDEKLTLINAGGSFVQTLTQNSRNGIPINQRDGLAYRGIFGLLSQDFAMTARDSGLTFVVGELKHFDAIGPATTTLSYEYGIGFPGDTSGFAPHRITCEVGAPYPAARVFASFAGNARDVDCDAYNSYGALGDKTRMVYLQRYGVAIQVHYANAKAVGDGRVIAATIE